MDIFAKHGALIYRSSNLAAFFKVFHDPTKMGFKFNTLFMVSFLSYLEGR